MVAEPAKSLGSSKKSCSLAKISMVAERTAARTIQRQCCSLAKISMVAELPCDILNITQVVV